MGNAFHEVSVAHDGVSKMVDDFVSGSVEGGGKEAFCNGHAHPIAKSLAQRSCRGLHSRSQPVLRMAGGFASPLTRVEEFRKRQVIPREMEQAVQKHGSMPC